MRDRRQKRVKKMINLVVRRDGNTGKGWKSSGAVYCYLLHNLNILFYFFLVVFCYNSGVVGYGAAAAMLFNYPIPRNIVYWVGLCIRLAFQTIQMQTDDLYDWDVNNSSF